MVWSGFWAILALLQKISCKIGETLALWYYFFDCEFAKRRCRQLGCTMSEQSKHQTMKRRDLTKRQMGKMLCWGLVVGGLGAVVPASAEQGLPKSDLPIISEAEMRARLADEAHARRLAKQAESSAKVGGGQATPTALPVQIPNELDLPPLVLEQSAKPSPAKANNAPKAKKSDKATKQPPIPASILALSPLVPAYPVIDQAGLLSDYDLEVLNEKVAEINESGNTKMAVLLIPTTNKQDIALYASQASQALALGEQGVLFVVATIDRNLFIWTGDHKKEALNDGVLRKMIDNDISPHFRENDFKKGVSAGVESLGEVLNPNRGWFARWFGDDEVPASSNQASVLATSQTVAQTANETPNASGNQPIANGEQATKRGSLGLSFVLFLLLTAIGVGLANRLGRLLGAVCGAVGFLGFALVGKLGFLGILGTLGVFCGLFVLLGAMLGASNFRHTKRPKSVGLGRFGIDKEKSDNENIGTKSSFGGGGAGGSW